MRLRQRCYGCAMSGAPATSTRPAGFNEAAAALLRETLDVEYLQVN